MIKWLVNHKNIIHYTREHRPWPHVSLVTWVTLQIRMQFVRQRKLNHTFETNKQKPFITFTFFGRHASYQKIKYLIPCLCDQEMVCIAFFSFALRLSFKLPNNSNTFQRISCIWKQNMHKSCREFSTLLQYEEFLLLTCKFMIFCFLVQ